MSKEGLPAAAPVPSLWGPAALPEEVAVALGEVAGGAGLRHHVHHPSARDRVQERRLLRACTKTTLVFQKQRRQERCFI
jgi:hypothetical protein